MSSEPPPGGGSEAPPPTEWVEIIEPRSGEHMYANLTSGECVWDPPVGVAVKKTNDNQWWELFDQNTSRFYYYNATSQKTVWHRPADCDIIPLAKLQTLKQNTEVKAGKVGGSSPEADPEGDKSLLSPGKRRLKKQVQKHRRKETSQQTDHPTPLARFLPSSNSTEVLSSSQVQTSPMNSPRFGSSRRFRKSHHQHHTPRRLEEAPSQLSLEHYKKPENNLPSIARSVSFMSKRINAFENYAPIGWKSGPGGPGSCSGGERGGGRSSVESTPTTSRRGAAVNGGSLTHNSGSSPEKSRITSSSKTSPIEGYCTPLNSRRRASLEQKSQQSVKSSQANQQPTISELVDSGLSALGEPPKKGTPNAAAVAPKPKMSPLQAYILEQAKLSGYDVDRDSYVESDVESRQSGNVASDSDDFADDEGCSDNLSKTSSSVDDDYLSAEPMYNNLEAIWRGGNSVGGQNSSKSIPPPLPKKEQPIDMKAPNIPNVDAFSEEFDLRMKINSRPTNGRSNSSTMPRPASIQPQSHHSSHSHHYQQPNYPVPYDVLHPSLQRNAHSLMVAGDSMSLQKNHKILHHSSLSVTASMEADMEKYAQDNFNVQKRGLFRKRLSLKAIMSWTCEAISKPLTCLPSEEKTSKKDAVLAFRLIQIYMGDRKAKPDMTINSVALDITNIGYNKPSLRDEIFVQLCKQTTDNPKKDSLRRGWELMAICLAFFPPSATFGPFLQGYISKHRDPSLDEFPDAHKWPIHIQISHYAGICSKRLERMGDGGRLRPKKPSIDDIDQSRLLIFRPSMFGGTLTETMEVQRERFPHLRLPWFMTTVADQILRLNGTGTEGIFRIPADYEEVLSLKSRFDQWEVVLCRDSHTAASLLKTWLRELYEPLIPDHFYDECVALAVNLDKESVTDPEKTKRLHNLISRLPELNALVLMYLIRFLQLFAQSSISVVTKMDDSNLATVFAPNFLRCPSVDPLVIMENARKEMTFVKHLIQCLDTTIAEGIL